MCPRMAPPVPDGELDCAALLHLGAEPLAPEQAAALGYRAWPPWRRRGGQVVFALPGRVAGGTLQMTCHGQWLHVHAVRADNHYLRTALHMSRWGGYAVDLEDPGTVLAAGPAELFDDLDHGALVSPAAAPAGPHVWALPPAGGPYEVAGRDVAPCLYWCPPFPRTTPRPDRVRVPLWRPMDAGRPLRARAVAAAAGDAALAVLARLPSHVTAEVLQGAIDALRAHQARLDGAT